jgi:TRAP-type C4-dicarboxylate transport system permease small subunit
MANARGGIRTIGTVVMLIGIVAAGLGGWDVFRLIWSGEGIGSLATVLNVLSAHNDALTILIRGGFSALLIPAGFLAMALGLVIHIVSRASEGRVPISRAVPAGSLVEAPVGGPAVVQ